MNQGFNQGFELSTTGGWKTYLDVDFTRLENKTLANGSQNFGGKSFTVENINSEATINIVNGSGLVWTLNSVGVNKSIGNMDSAGTPPNTGFRTAPLISVQSSAVFPTTTLDDRKRVVAFFDMGANYPEGTQSACLRYEQAANPLFCFTQLIREYVSPNKGLRARLSNGSARTNQQVTVATNVNAMELDITGLFVTTRYGVDKDFRTLPPAQTLTVFRQYSLEPVAANTSTTYNGPTDRFVFAGYDVDSLSPVNFSFTLKRLVIQRLDS